jgi:putative ABC transport system substrate-binding protein
LPFLTRRPELASIPDAFSRAKKPADPPVQLVTKVELFINLKAAKTLGVTVPLPLLGRADQVIE